MRKTDRNTAERIRAARTIINELRLYTKAKRTQEELGIETVEDFRRLRSAGGGPGKGHDGKMTGEQMQAIWHGVEARNWLLQDGSSPVKHRWSYEDCCDVLDWPPALLRSTFRLPHMRPYIANMLAKARMF